MLCDMDVEEAIWLCRKKGATHTRDLISALRAMNVVCSPRRIQFRGKFYDMPARTLLVWVYNGKKGRQAVRHWTVYHRGCWYDSQLGIRDSYPAEWLNRDILPRSYLEIDSPHIKE